MIRLLVDFTVGGTVGVSDGTLVRGGPVEQGVAGLTPREVEVLRLLAAGMSNAEIGGDLGLSVNTIERHVGNVYRKIDARGRGGCHGVRDPPRACLGLPRICPWWISVMPVRRSAGMTRVPDGHSLGA